MPKTFSYPDTVDPKYLEEVHDAREFRDVRFEFEPEEMDEMRLNAATIGTQLYNRAELLKKISKAVNDSYDVLESLEIVSQDIEHHDVEQYGAMKTKEMKAEVNRLNGLLSAGFTMKREELLGIVHYEVGRMALYSKEGIFIDDRKLNPSEKQTTILQMGSKTA